jgi:hypothetical protein
VPISGIEARALVEVVEGMPEPRRSAVRGRFAAARRRLAEAGLLGTLLRAGALGKEELRPLGIAYFDLAIACPLLEDESCSIHPLRPCVCREYVVVSPPANCAGLTPGGVKCVVLPGKVSVALNLMTGRGEGYGQWVPLVLVPEWVAAHPEGLPARPGAELLRELLSRLAGRALPFPALGAPAGGKGV